MTLLAFSWPVALVTSVAIAAISLLAAIVIWQTFAIIIKDDREIERERRFRGSEQ
jgi:hypothetical protein